MDWYNCLVYKGAMLTAADIDISMPTPFASCLWVYVPCCSIAACCCRDADGQWQAQEGQTASQAQNPEQVDFQAEETDQDGDGQLPVNTLFYGVRGQQVCF